MYKATVDSDEAVDTLETSRGGVWFMSEMPLVPEEDPDSIFVVATERLGRTRGHETAAVIDSFPALVLGARLDDPPFVFGGESLGTTSVTFLGASVTFVCAIFLKEKTNTAKTQRENKKRN